MTDAAVGAPIFIRRQGGSYDVTQPEAGTITYVNKDGTVNIAGLTKMGEHFSMTSVALVEDDSHPKGDYVAFSAAHVVAKPIAPAGAVSAKGQPKQPDALAKFLASSKP
jgi:hypothetical protein